MNDTYRIRSCYSSALGVIYWAYDDCDFSEKQPFDWVQMQLSEFISVRDYFSCDYYPLINHCVDDSSWATLPGIMLRLLQQVLMI